MLVSHGHEEARKHAVQLINKSDKDECKIICIGELAEFFTRNVPGVKNDETTSLYNIKRLNKGGSLSFPKEKSWCKITMVHADHSSSCESDKV